MNDCDSFRLVICIDVRADNLTDAYSKTYKAMASLPEDMEWESSDEAFYGDGNSVTPGEMQDARTAFFDPKKERNK